MLINAIVEGLSAIGCQTIPARFTRFQPACRVPNRRYEVRYFHLGSRIAANATKPDARAFLAGQTNARRRIIRSRC